MIWKLQPSPVQFIPVPYSDVNHLIGITDWQFKPEVKPLTFDISDPDTNETHTVEIFDYLGPYPMDNIPNWIARFIAVKLTGKLLAALLRKRKPEFHDTKQVLFYQVNPILKNGNEEKTN